METLIIKLGAAGDVVRTTPLLKVLPGEIDWFTNDENMVLLYGNRKIRTLIPWSQNKLLENKNYDLVINLEDLPIVAKLLKKFKYKDLFGAYINDSGYINYTENSKGWFDMSLISRFGKEIADKLKFNNRKSYQEIIFEGLGYRFTGEKYYIPNSIEKGLKGDIAIAPYVGNVWPNKKWAYYKELRNELLKIGYNVNMLPIRESLLEHIADIRNHKILISGDTLPMHIALGCGLKCITLFTCTSPWEIYDYSIQKKIVSPYLKEFFYKRSYDDKATTCIHVDEVLNVLKTFF